MVDLDFTKLKVPVKKHDNCTVIDVGSGAFPRYIEVRMPGKDGARRTALWDGLLNLSNNDKVMCEEYPGNPVLRIVGFGGDQDAQATTIWTRTGTEIDPTNDGDNLVLHDDAGTTRMDYDPGTSSAAATFIIRDQTGAKKLEFSTDNVFRFKFSSGGLDTNQNLFAVEVTGNPTLIWSEDNDRFLWNKGHEITAGDVLIPDDLVHYQDADTLLSFTDDLIELQAGGVVMLSLIEAATDEVVINNNQVDIDFRVEGDTEEHLFFVDGGNDVISIGETSFANVKFNIGGGIESAGDHAFGMYTGGLIVVPGNNKQAFFGYFGGGQVETGAANTIAYAMGLYSEVMNKGGTGTITNAYGLFVHKSTIATSNYGAYIEGDVGIGIDPPTAELHVDQASATAAQATLALDQADLSEEFIEFITTVGAGNPIDTAAIGAYYGKARVSVAGVGFKYIALYDS